MLTHKPDLLSRPTDRAARNLLTALKETGVGIKLSAFDYIDPGPHRGLDLNDIDAVRAAIGDLLFIEVKSTSSPKVGPGFEKFFFSFSEGELAAAEQLGQRHVVVLNNLVTGEQLATSVPELLARSRSQNWSLSIQLGPSMIVGHSVGEIGEPLPEASVDGSTGP